MEISKWQVDVDDRLSEAEDQIQGNARAQTFRNTIYSFWLRFEWNRT